MLNVVKVKLIIIMKFSNKMIRSKLIQKIQRDYKLEQMKYLLWSFSSQFTKAPVWIHEFEFHSNKFRHISIKLI
jgi:hypothetical protein